MQIVRKAIIPAAGLGTRWYPVTKVIPKEMLPINKKPAIQWIIEEAVEAKIKQICIIIRKEKELIKDYINNIYKNKSKKISISYIYQVQPKGLGDAILSAKNFVGDEPFMVFLPDDIFEGSSPIYQLLKLFSEIRHSCFGLAKVKKAHLNRYGAFTKKKVRDGLYRILGVGEKGKILNIEHEDCIRGIGRYVFLPEVLKLRPNFRNWPNNKELDDADLLRELLKRDEIYGLVIKKARRFDIGHYDGYIDALSNINF